jgi:hypothetical protein
MEELWKKFKEETKEDMEKIGEFLRESRFVKPMEKEPNSFQPQPLEKIERNISQQIVLDDENSKKDVSSNKNYGSLTKTVKEIMAKEHISRAQAYRRAKKISTEKSHS